MKVNTSRSRHVQDGFSFDLQLKSTIQWRHDGDAVVYDLEAKAWNDMVERAPEANRLYLGLMCLPADEESWLACDEDRTVLQRACYWFYAGGEAETDNLRTKTIRIPRVNLITPGSLTDLMSLARIPRRDAR